MKAAILANNFENILQRKLRRKLSTQTVKVRGNNFFEKKIRSGSDKIPIPWATPKYFRHIYSWAGEIPFTFRRGSLEVWTMFTLKRLFTVYRVYGGLNAP